MEKIKNWHIHILGIIMIAALCLINIRATDYICIVNDEFGYWAHAVSAVGYDWKDLISEASYYSWGYSIWLIPIAALLPTPELWYKAAVFLNIFFLIASYFMCYKSGCKLFREKDERLTALVSCLVVIYPANIVYAQASWTETLSYFLVWAITWLIICLDEKFSDRTFAGVLLLLIYAYAVHNRNIGVVAAGLIALCAVLVKHKKKFWYFVILLISMATGYEGIDLVKNHQIQTLWSNSKTSALNNVGLNTVTLTSYSNRLFNQLDLFLKSLFGKYIYLLIGTGLTLPIAVIMFFRDAIRNIKNKKLWEDYEISKIWIVLTAGLMYGICAIQMNNWEGRMDLIVYGRYMENGLGPILFLSIMYCILQTRETRAGLLAGAISMTVGIIPVYYWITHSSGWFNTICSPVVGAFYQAVRDMRWAFIFIGVLLIAAFGVLFGLTFCRKINIRSIVIVTCFVLTYSVLGYYGGTYAVENRGFFDGLTVPLREKLSGDLAQDEIYYIKNDELDYTSIHPKYLQFLIPDRTIHVFLLEEMEDLPGENIIVMMNPEDQAAIEYLEQNRDIEEVDDTWLMKVYAVDGLE